MGKAHRALVSLKPTDRPCIELCLLSFCMLKEKHLHVTRCYYHLLSTYCVPACPDLEGEVHREI